MDQLAAHHGVMVKKEGLSGSQDIAMGYVRKEVNV